MITLKIQGLTIQVSPKNIKIFDSWKIKKKSQMKNIIEEILYQAPIYQRNRSIKSLVREWRSHNILYHFHLFTIHTQDCDLEVNEAFHRKIVYFFLGRF